MTGFAQVKGELVSQGEGSAASQLSGSTAQGNGRLGFSLSLKAVNHRFLDLHFRLPSGSDAIEMQLRRLLKEKIARGHVEVTLSLERGGSETLALNRPLVSAYIAAFRAAANEFSVPAEPDLNVILRIPGALDSAGNAVDGALESAVMAAVGEVLDRLNHMREQEGRGIEYELRERMKHLREAVKIVEEHRHSMLHSYLERLRSAFRSCWVPLPTAKERFRKQRSWSTAATSRKKSFGWKTMSSIFWACSMNTARWGRNSTSYYRK